LKIVKKLKHIQLMKNTFFLLILLFSVLMHSQTANDLQKMNRQTNSKALKTLANESKQQFLLNKNKALQFAKDYNLPVYITQDSVYSELVGISKNNKPIYYSTYNLGAGITSRASKLNTGGSLGLNINGEDIIAGVWDVGSGMPAHELFEGRLTLIDNASSTHYHSCHVAGTIIGSGLFQNGKAKGMASKGLVNSYDWNNDVAEVAEAAANGLMFSNHSYGRSPSNVETYQWGKYNEEAQRFDAIMFNAPYYQFVCAAGNSRGDFNSSKNGYDVLSGHSLSKNAITVAAVNEVLNYSGSSSVQMSNFSSWGPSDDGRIKPDISAKGVSLFSAVDSSTSSYRSLSGTSMASPSVVGTLMLYQQYYKQLYNSYMKASTLKGLMIHTADEAGVSDGPDYGFGWGLINAEKAALLMQKKDLQSLLLENSLNNTDTYTIAVNSLGTEPLVATLCWTDPKGSLPDDVTDSATPSLINDLDVRITQNLTSYYPWKLNPINPSAPATKGDNLVDTVEKVEINNPTGSYVISVSKKGTLLNNSQNYSLIVSGITLKDFWFTTVEPSKSICNEQSTLAYTFNLATKSNFTGTISLTAIGLPANSTASFSPSTMNAAGVFVLTLSNTNSLTPGSYTFTVKGTSNSDTFESQVTLVVLTPVIVVPTLSQPSNNAIGIAIPTRFSWINDVNAQSYTIEIATNSDFSTVIQTAIVTKNEFNSTLLSNGSHYFWRVKSNNSCGLGTFSAPFSFTTACKTPTNCSLSDATSTTALVSWTDNSGSSSWEIEYVLQNELPTGKGISVTSASSLITGLKSNSCYKLYVRSICDGGYSSWTSPFTFCTTTNYCAGDHFYDNGGLNGNYPTHDNLYKTINPTGIGNRVKAIFNSFQLANNDSFKIYNGSYAFSEQLLFSYNGTNSPTTIQSTDSSGALTFVFNGNSSTTASGWDASIVCEPLPPCSNPPTNIYPYNISTTAATFYWTENSSANSWEIEIVAHGTTPTGLGTTISSNSYTKTGLTSNTWYDFYVRSRCGTANSTWTGPIGFNTLANYCGGDHFYDNGGGSANYPANDNFYKTIYPTANGNRVKAIFNSFLLNNTDTFMVYSGTNSSSDKLLFTYNGTNSPTTLLSTDSSGALTFVFNGGNTTTSGWDASIVCEPIPPCSIVPSNIYQYSITTTAASFSWTENSRATSWEIEIVPHGTTPKGSGTIISNSYYTKTGLTSNTWYDFYVRSRCGTANSTWTGPIGFNTLANYCGGDHFYDNGGLNANYPANDNLYKTISPSGNGNRVKAIFNSFQLNNTDSFMVYSGTYTSSDKLLFTYNGTNSPTTLTSADSSGALTFVFNGGTTPASGWDASIVCEPIPLCSIVPSNIYKYGITTTAASFSWTENASATSWEIKIVAHGTLPTGSGTTISTSSCSPTGLTSNTWYDFYVRSRCGSTNSTWSAPIDFKTLADYCGGDHFYDNGGPNANYPAYDNLYQTIYPTANGNRVKAIFNSFLLGNASSFQVYSGTYTSTKNLLFTYNGTNSPTTLTSADPSGALTFVFNANSSTSASGWDASIVCEPIPACSIAPANIYKYGITTTAASFSWTENTSATSWEIEIVAHGTTPTGTGTIVSSNPFTKTGLTSNTWYDIYVRSRCGSTNSTWSSPIDFKTLADYCGGDHFYDNGGLNANYPAYDNLFKTIYPTANGNRVKAIFNSFQLGSNSSFQVYSGTSSSSDKLLFTYTGTNSPTTLTSTDLSGALTFIFYGGSSTTASGWDASIVCEPKPACAIAPTSIYKYTITTTAASFSWTENSAASSWEIEIVVHGRTPTGSGTIISSNPYTKTGLTSSTWYDFYVRSRCGSANSTWSGPIAFNTLSDYCGGDHFYDNGGPNANYPTYDNLYKTIYPTASGNRVKAVFNSFQLGNTSSFQVYSGTSTSADKLLFTYNGTNSPTTLTSTEPSGALTFAFNANSSTSASGWDASIVCEPIPVCSIIPTSIYQYDVTTTAASFSWTENSSATSWEIEIVAHGATPTGSGTIITSNPYTKTGLSTNTWYNFYVRSRCGTVNSTWSAPIAFNTLADYCNGDHLYDNGGPNGNYPVYDNFYKTIYPTGTGNRVKAVFNSFQLGSNCSFQVYNGSTSDKLLYSYNGTNSPTTLQSTDLSGALTFAFYGGGSSITASGWDASIVCEPIPACSNPPSTISVSNLKTTEVSFSWTENSNATSWEIEIVAHGTTPTGSGIIISSNPYTKTGLTVNTAYDLYIRSKCGTANSLWSGPIAFNTLPDYCTGEHFYDNGGAAGNYENNTNQTKIIYPTNPANKVSVTFVSLILEECCDRLKIYNGPNSNSPLLFSSSGATLPGTLTSTAVTGALTFVFTSDSSGTGSGWEAIINCTTLDNPDRIYDYSIIDYYPNPVTNVLNVKSKETIKKFEMYDVNSRLISKEVVNKNEFEIDFSKNGSGVYLVKLFTAEGNSKELKIIKK
jgi:hypothetical protein